MMLVTFYKFAILCARFNEARLYFYCLKANRNVTCMINIGLFSIVFLAVPVSVDT